MMKKKSSVKLNAEQGWKEKVESLNGLGKNRGKGNFIEILVEKYPDLGKKRKLGQSKYKDNKIHDELDLI
jgi:hypothetical protein